MSLYVDIDMSRQVISAHSGCLNGAGRRSTRELKVMQKQHRASRPSVLSHLLKTNYYNHFYNRSAYDRRDAAKRKGF
jgi:hypothetical protein